MVRELAPFVDIGGIVGHPSLLITSSNKQRFAMVIG